MDTASEGHPGDALAPGYQPAGVGPDGRPWLSPKTRHRMQAAAEELLLPFLTPHLADESAARVTAAVAEAAADIVAGGWDPGHQSYADAQQRADLSEATAQAWRERHHGTATYADAQRDEGDFRDWLDLEIDWAVERLAGMFIGNAPMSMAQTRTLARDLRERRERSLAAAETDIEDEDEDGWSVPLYSTPPTPPTPRAAGGAPEEESAQTRVCAQ